MLLAHEVEVATTQAQTMNAIVQTEYGTADVLRVGVEPRPICGDNDVLVRVHATSVCKAEIHYLTGTPYVFRLMAGLRRPKHRILGQDVAGRVEAVGKGITRFAVGDAVYGQAIGLGAFAEYVAVSEELLAPMPSNLSFAEAAAVPLSAMTALQGLRDVGKLQRGQRLLVNGASGGVGTFAVQIAKALGAEVTAVCSARHVEMLRSIGADHVVDYGAEDFAKSSRRYDVMLDLVGNRSVSDCQRVLEPKGIFVSSAGSPGGPWIGPMVWMLKVVLAGLFGSQTMSALMGKPRREDLLVLTEMIEAGEVKPVIERRHPLHEGAEAVRHVAAGHAHGKTVITVIEDARV